MAKLIHPNVYHFGDNLVECMPYFLYEVSIHLVTKNMVSLLDCQFYKSNKLLEIKEYITIRKHKNYSIIRYIDILGVTETFIKENNLLKLKNKNERTR